MQDESSCRARGPQAVEVGVDADDKYNLGHDERGAQVQEDLGRDEVEHVGEVAEVDDDREEEEHRADRNARDGDNAESFLVLAEVIGADLTIEGLRRRAVALQYARNAGSSEPSKARRQRLHEKAAEMQRARAARL